MKKKYDPLRSFELYLIDSVLCNACPLEGTFCEGDRCESQSERFNNETTPKELKQMLFDFFGKKYYSFSLKTKLNLKSIINSK